jgi:hypothetical protein
MMRIGVSSYFVFLVVVGVGILKNPKEMGSDTSECAMCFASQ